jgi:hypothetical protein
MAEPQLDIARNIEAVEHLKVNLCSYLADLYNAILKGDSVEFLDASANLNITCFLLTKRLGLNFGHLEKQVYENTRAMLKGNNRLEEWYGDLSALKDYMDLKR